MSRFLAPIHSWLFNKIKKHEELEQILIERFRSVYGSGIDEVVSKSYELYGHPLENKPLEDLIDTSNIHGWLQNRIEIAETRQSYIISELQHRYAQGAEELSLDVYKEYGLKCGKDARDNFDTDAAPQIYRALNNYILDGMPCDNVNSIFEQSENILIWKNTECLHRRYWEEAGANIEFSYELRNIWIKNFVEGASPSFTYVEKTESINDDIVFVHEIIKR